MHAGRDGPAVIDTQRVSGDPGAWATPRFAEIVPRIRMLTEALAPAVGHLVVDTETVLSSV
jgi:hypothetical protein